LKSATGAPRVCQFALLETEPIEVAQAARCFNIIQRRLKMLLATRPHVLSSISHDLRMPLTRTRMRIEKITDEKLKSEIDKDLLEMDSMIEEALCLLRTNSERGQFVKTDLIALIDGLVDDMRELGMEINFESDTIVPVELNPQAIRRCIGNILENARRYGGGKLISSYRSARYTCAFL
jgi:signal transduction histidine kinase